MLIHENWQRAAGGILVDTSVPRHGRTTAVHSSVQTVVRLIHQTQCHHTGRARTNHFPLVVQKVMHRTLNKLFGKPCCHSQTVYRKQPGIVHCSSI